MLSKKDQLALLDDWSFMSRIEIAEKYNISLPQVDQIIRKHGRRNKNIKPLTEEQKYYIVSNPQISITALARELKVGYMAVAKVRKKITT